MPNTLTDFLNSINRTKINLFKVSENDSEETEKEYKKLSFVINRILSYFPDTIFYSQELNMRSTLPAKAQYDFYLHGLSKKSRFSGKVKVDNPEDFELVQKYYDYSDKKTRKALEILTPENIETIKNRTFKGGILNSSSKVKKTKTE